MRLSATRLIASSNRRGSRVSSQSAISVEQLERHILMHAADAEIIGMHARARSALEEVEVSSRSSNIHRFGVIAPTSMTWLPRLSMWFRCASARRRTRADIARGSALRGSSSFSTASTIAVLHAQRRAVIEPVEIGQRLQIGLVLDQLLGAAVEQADMRIDPLDDLAVQLHDQAQHAVRGRMLRAEIDRVVLDRGIARRDRRVQPFGCCRDNQPLGVPSSRAGRGLAARHASASARALAALGGLLSLGLGLGHRAWVLRARR
jgi:hypothetical protein